jgi:hypothetical protein
MPTFITSASQNSGELPYAGIRIVHAASFHADKDGAAFFNCDLKFQQGMVQAGCHVFPFSINDRARQLTWTNSKYWGIGKANKSLLNTCRNIHPDALILGHGQQITVETLEAIRKSLPDIRIGFWYIDPIWAPKAVEHLNRRAHLFNAICCTSGGELLKQFCRPGTPAAFIPNPVDAGVERLRAFEQPKPDHDVLYFGRDKHASHRGEFIRKLREALPEARCSFFGSLGERLVFGAEKDAIIARSSMGLNLSRRTDVPLYSSDRMAQLVGNGVLTLQQRGAGFEELYTEDELGYYSDFDDLLNVVRHFLKDDDHRREVARNGWKKSHTEFSSRRCAEFLLNLTFRRQETFNAPWASHILWHPADSTRITPTKIERRKTA